jgi:uncharacterized membrane protein YcaP (DUF421 family)
MLICSIDISIPADIASTLIGGGRFELSLAHVFTFWQFIIRGVVVYTAIIILLRLGGKRQVGQMGAGEFVAILLISNAVQNSMNGGDNSISGGLILAAVIIGLSLFVAWATFKSKKVEHLVQGVPTLLIHNGKVIKKNLDKELLSERELKAALRRQGISEISEIHVAILESDGFISVVRVGEGKPENHAV